MFYSAFLVLGTVLSVSGTIGRISPPPPLNNRDHFPQIQIYSPPPRPGSPQSPIRTPSSGRTSPGSAGFQPIRNEPGTAQNDPGLNLTFVISGNDIPKKGKLSKINTYIKVYYTNKTVTEPVKVATTETVTKNSSPEYLTVISFLWKRGEEQKLLFKVKEKGTFSDDTLGEGLFEVDDYVMNKNQKTNISLDKGGTLLIQKTTPISFQLYARNLPSMDPVGLSDPFVICYWKRGQTGVEHKFYQTKHINDVQNADWNENITFENYIKGTDLWFVFKVKDHDTASSADDLGEALVEVDPYATDRHTKTIRIGKAGQATLAITPL